MILKRSDLQGVWEEETNSLRKWYEYILATYLENDQINDEEFDELIKVTDEQEMLTELKDYAELYEFEFSDITKSKKCFM